MCRARAWAGHAVGTLAGAMTAPRRVSGAVAENPAAPAQVNRNTARRVVPLFRPYRAQVAAVVVLIVVTSTIGIINPLLIQAVFNKALFVPGGPNLHLLVILVSIMAVVPIVNGAIGILQVYETTRVGQLVMRDLRDQLYSHLQTLPLAFFTSTKTGEIQSRLANDVGGVQSVVTTTASTILANVVTFVSTIVAMVILSWQLTIVAVITVPVFFWLTKMVGERRRQVARSTQESLAAMSALSEETLSVSGVLLAKVFGNQARDTARYHEENQRLADLEVRQQMIGQGFYAIVQSFLSITPAAVYLVAGLLLANGTASPRAPSLRSPRCRPACTSRSGSCCRSPWSCDRLWPCSTGSSSTWTWCPISSMPPTPSICRRSAVAAGWRSERSISATPACPWTRWRASPSKPTLASSWRWSGRAGPARPPSAT